MAGIDLGSLSAKIKLDSSEAERGLESFQDKAKATGESLTSIGTKMTAIGTAGTVAIGGLLKAGGDFQAQVAGTEFLMKNLDEVVRDTINTNAKHSEAIGLTSKQYKDGASNLATFYKNMGISATESAKMSKVSMELIADLGAITDMPFDEALGRFKSGLMGNYEALDKLNINISATSLESSAFVKSLGKSWKKMSDNEKIMAIYSEVIRQGAYAKGLASQEAEQFSMKVKLLTVKVKELVGQIGQSLIPIVEPLVGIFEKIIDKVTEWVSNNQQLVGVILAVVGGMSAFLVVAGLITTAIGLVSTAIGSLGISAGAVIGTIGAIAGAFLTVIGSSDTFVQKMGEVGRSIILGIKTAIENVMLELPRFMYIGMDIVGNLVTGIWTAIPNIVTALGNFISTGLNVILHNLPHFIDRGRQVVMSIIQGVINRLPNWLDTMGQGIMKVLNEIAIRLPEFLAKGTDIVTRLTFGIAQNIPKIMAKMGELLGKVIAKIVEYLPQFLAKGVEIVAKLIVGLYNSLPRLLTAGRELLIHIKDGIISGLGGLLSVGKDIVNSLLKGIKSAWGSLTSWVGGAISKLNPFKKKTIEIEGEVNDSGLQRLNLGNSPMARGISSNPTLFGFSKSRTFEPAKPLTTSMDKNSGEGSKEIVVEIPLYMEGQQIAKASARFMRDELEILDRRANRLGGK